MIITVTVFFLTKILCISSRKIKKKKFLDYNHEYEKIMIINFFFSSNQVLHVYKVDVKRFKQLNLYFLILYLSVFLFLLI